MISSRDEFIPSWNLTCKHPLNLWEKCWVIGIWRIKKNIVKNFSSFYRGIVFCSKKWISNVKMNRYAEIGSPWWAPFSRLKDFVVKPPLSTHDSCLYNNILIQSVKFSQNPTFFKEILWNYDSVSRKFFLYPLLINNLIFKLFVTLKISKINLPPSPRNRFSILPVCSKDIIEGSTVFTLETNAFEIIFKSTSSTLRSRITGAPRLLFGKIFWIPPLLLEPPRLLIFDY